MNAPSHALKFREITTLASRERGEEMLCTYFFALF